MKTGYRGLCALALACIVTSAAEARGDTRTVAEALFRDGAQLLAAGRAEEACPKFAESQKVDPALGTLFYLAICHEKQGLTASAWSEFSSATEWAERTNQPERVLLGRKHVAQLEAKLSKVVVHATRIPGFELRVDGGPLSAAAVDTPLPLDPGSHTIQASAPGYEPWQTTITLSAAAETMTVIVPPLAEKAAEAPLVADTAVLPPQVATPKPADAPVHSKPSILTWTSGGVAVAGLVVGSVFGGMTFAARDRAISECPANRCASGGLSDIDHAKTYAAISTVGFGAGLVATAATTYLLLRGNSASSRRTAALSAPRRWTVAPSVSAHEANLAVVGQFE